MMDISPGLMDYVSGLENLDSGKAKYIDAKLKKIPNNLLGMEEEQRDLLLTQKVLHTYPKLNLEFLSMSEERMYDDKFVQVSRCSIFRHDNRHMNIMFGHHDNYYPYCAIENAFDWPREIVAPFLRSFELFPNDHFFSSSENRDYKHYGWFCVKPEKLLPRAIRRKYKKLGKLSFSRTFQGFVPPEVRDKIMEWKDVFSDNIFVIGENKSGDQEKLVIPGYLIVGVRSNSCFYMGEFKTESLDDCLGEGLIK